MRQPGSADRDVPRTYHCPVHGLFNAEISGPAPDELPCPLTSWSVPGGDKEYASQEEAEVVAQAAGYYPGRASFETQRCADTSRIVR